MRISDPIPKISQPLLRLFTRYSAGYLGRHFSSIRILQAGLPPNDSANPLVVYLNHAAWWDPLVCLFLKREFFTRRSAYAPMDAVSLNRYGFLKWIGFFPVEPGTTRGAAQFLQTSSAILEREASALFLTPEGKFADVRAPLLLAPGLAHLARRAGGAIFLPLAIEYSFWEERKPEILLAFGAPLRGGGEVPLADRLAATQALLARAAQKRQPNDWKILLRGGSGVSRPYDLWRWLRARLRGAAFRADHGRL